jgi:hypothetical protein
MSTPDPAAAPTDEQMSRSLPSVDPDALRKRGYAIVRRVFDAEEIGSLRTAARETIADMEREGRTRTFPGREGTALGGDGDLLDMPRLRHVLYDPRMVSVVQRLLGGPPVYFGDSTFRVGKSGIRGWHRDSVNRRRWRGGPDWHDPPYPLLRCGLYLQDQSRHSGGLALRPRSNRPGLVRPTLPKLVNASAGDLIAWDLRTVHSGEAVRLRGLPQLPLHPRLQTHLPDGLRVPEDGERIVLFMAFARPGAHLDRYVKDLRGRGDLPELSSTRYAPEVRAEAENAGLRILAPIAAHDQAPADRAKG